MGGHIAFNLKVLIITLESDSKHQVLMFFLTIFIERYLTEMILKNKRATHYFSFRINHKLSIVQESKNALLPLLIASLGENGLFAFGKCLDNFRRNQYTVELSNP